MDQTVEPAAPTTEPGSGGAFWALLALLVAAAAALIVLQVNRPKPPEPYVGLPLPPIEASGWINAKTPLTAADLRGKVVLLDFWATWCGPCRASVPKLINLHKRYGDRVIIVGLTEEDGPAVENVKNFVATRDGLKWPIGYGAALAYQVMDISGIPTYVLYDRTGRSIWGGHSLDGLEDALIAALAKK